MKNAHEIVIQSVAQAAAAIGLGLLASAQTTGGGEPRHGRPVLEGSLENDIREGRGPRPAGEPQYWGEVVVDLSEDLTLTVRLMGNEEIDPAAVLPLAEDFDKALRIEGGLPGHVALVEIGSLVPSLDRRGHGLAGGAVISGFYGENGEFEVELPRELDVRQLGLRAASVPTRTVTEVVDLEEAVEAAFASFSPLGHVANPSAIGGAGMHELSRPLPSQGAGRAARAAITGRSATVTVDPAEEDAELATFVKLGDVAKPDGMAASAGKQVLSKPSSGAGSTGRAQITGRMAIRLIDLSDDIVESEISWEKLGDVANPDRIGGSGSREELRRPARRGSHGRRG